MVDVHTSEKRSFNMSRIRCKDTKPELILKDMLIKKDFFYQEDLYGKPDFINFKIRVIIFVDGCFWHKCPDCFKTPSTNKKFWMDKINKNTMRDKEVTLNYKYSGWKVVRIWEHSLKSLRTRKFINAKIYKYL